MRDRGRCSAAHSGVHPPPSFNCAVKRQIQASVGRDGIVCDHHDISCARGPTHFQKQLEALVALRQERVSALMQSVSFQSTAASNGNIRGLGFKPKIEDSVNAPHRLLAPTLRGQERAPAREGLG